MQASLRSHHHQLQQQQQQQHQQAQLQQQQQQPDIQQYYEYQTCDTSVVDVAPTYEAPIRAIDQQSVPDFDQANIYADQRHLSAPCGNLYASSTSIYYDLSQNYGANAAGQAPDEVVDQNHHHEHQLKVIELQESYHQYEQQQQHYLGEAAAVNQTQQEHSGQSYSTAAIYADPFARTRHCNDAASYNQDTYLTQPSGPYYATHENSSQSHQCYSSQAAHPLTYYEAQSVHLAAGDNCALETRQLDSGLYQSSQIDYQQLEESRKQHDEQRTLTAVYQNTRTNEQQASQRNSFSSALSTSSSCLSANSAKLFSNEDENDDEDASYEDDEDDNESEDSTLPRDQKKAKEANIPLSYNEIVNLSIDQFNEHIARFQYNEAQLTLMKDIRRRGKNKVAAQTCRKRKMEQIMELQHEVGQLANKRMALSCDLNRLVQDHIRQANEYERLYSIIQVHMQSKPTADCSTEPTSNTLNNKSEGVLFGSTSAESCLTARQHHLSTPRNAC